MTIYVDILIILNTLVNYFILLGVRKITRSHTSRWRIALGALTGGLSSLLIFLDDLGIIMTFLKTLTSIIMVTITFGINPVKQFLKKIFWLFAVCFLFGGLMLAVYMLFDTDVLIYANGIIYFDIDMTFLVVCSVLSYIVITVITKFIDKKAPRNNEYYITVQHNGKTVSCTALMDTGNNLREPFSGFPVIMIEKKLFSELYGNEEGKIRLIPVSTVNGDALLRAFKPDYIKINERSVDKVYLGESTVPLNEYKIILNINLEGEMHND